MLGLILTLFVILLITMFFFAFILVGFKKRIPCPVCEFKLKAVTKTVRCPKCKTKLYKQDKGVYISNDGTR